MYTLYAFLAGLVFGIGLIVSELYSPVKVLGFLDLAGKWDPSLLLAMAGAVAVGVVAFAVASRRTQTLLGTPMHLPPSKGIDRRMVLGSLVFGMGWGLAGFCPGPALVALGTGHVKAFMFVVAMLAGMGIFELVERARAQRARGAAAHGHARDRHHAGGRHKGRKNH